MAGITPNINLIPNDPSLADVLNYFKKELKLELNCMHLGTIESFNSLTQQATVSINYSKSYLKLNSIGEVTVIPQDYAPIIDAPVFVWGGGAGSLEFPIESGDECAVLFNDRDMDNWFAGSSNSVPATPRLHSFADACILVGIRSLGNVLMGYDASATTLRYGTNTVKLNSNGVTITQASGTPAVPIVNATVQVSATSITATFSTGVSLELTAAGTFKVTNASAEYTQTLINLMTDIQNGLVTTMLGPQPLVMPDFATHLAEFSTFE